MEIFNAQLGRVYTNSYYHNNNGKFIYTLLFILGAKYQFKLQFKKLYNLLTLYFRFFFQPFTLQLKV